MIDFYRCYWLGKHKALEVSIRPHPGIRFLWWPMWIRYPRDHYGFFFDLVLFQQGIEINFYDVRHEDEILGSSSQA